MATQHLKEPKKLYNAEFLTPHERQDRIVEILTRGVLRLIEKKKHSLKTRTTKSENCTERTDTPYEEKKEAFKKSP